MNISQKPVAIVSGASRGIGRAIAILLSQKGYAVVGLYKKEMI
jgi:NAD(P)-dependent dehydrogenase (short-subunit alcohol dehydrogenase family)